jgi:hypothetical protein
VDDGGLPDAGFAAHQCQAPRAAHDRLQVTGEVLKYGVSL